MTEIEVREERTLVIPATGEIIDLNDEVACSNALELLRRMRNQVNECSRALQDAIIARSQVLGTKTIHLPSGFKAVIKGGNETVYNGNAIKRELIAAGMPRERADELIQEVVDYKVDAVRLKQAAAANPAYAEIVERHKTVTEKPANVAIER